MRMVGILGGMGPAATLDLMARVMAAVPAQDDRDHVPLMVDQNPQVPSRIARLIEGDGEDPAPVLADMARRLQGAGAQALAMACNTAHHYADAVRDAVDIPFLDMVDIAAAHVPHGAEVALLASPAVAQIGLYDAALATRGATIRHPKADAALDLIRHVKARGPDAEAQAAFHRLSAQV
ncbi:MAG: amino acid racemase, partial [Pseudomonadota bacterium]